MLVLASCGDGGTGVGEGDRIASVQVVPTDPTVRVGGTVELDVLVLNRRGEEVTGANVSWVAAPADVATVSGTGIVTGRGVGSATVTATAGGVQGQTTVTVTPPAALEIATESLPHAVVGKAFAATLEASGGVPPYSWSHESGTLPPGIALAADGALSGTPQTAGGFTFTVRVSSEDGQTALAERTVSVLAPLSIDTHVLGEAEVGVSYAAALQASGGEPPYVWSHLDGELPQGLELAGDGTLSGTPTRVGTFSFSVRVTSDDGQVATGGVALTVAGDPLPLAITTASLPGGTVGESYSAPLDATGGKGELLWRLDSGSLPQGLELADAGTILGVPADTDTVTFTVRVSDDATSDIRSLTLRVVADPFLNVATAVLAPARVGRSYEEALRASGGEPPYEWRLAGGFVPGGLGLDSDGVLSGVPTQPGEATFTAEVRSADGQVATARLELDVEGLEDTSPEGYDLTVLAVAGISAALRSHVTAAVRRWERVVVGDLEDLTIPPDAFAPASCGGFGSDLNDLRVEDIAVLVNIAPIDGPGRVLGRAGPCGIRENGLPFAGILTLDSEDLEPLVGTRTLTDLIFHEIAHVLGFGTLWEAFALLQGAGGSDPRYVGGSGVEQYEALGGTAADIPVANTGGGGTRDSHWREDTFGSEIMTGYAEAVGTAMPLSAMTIGSVADLGYLVDLEEADPFTISDAVAPAPAPAKTGPGWDLVLREPLVVVYRDGSLGRIGER